MISDYPDQGLVFAALAAAGLVIGSFVNLVAVRLPRNQAVVWSRSRTDCCDRPLSARELIPVISWLGQRGRCSRCGARIAARHPLVELAGGGLGAWSAVSAGAPMAALASALLGWQLLLIALIDADEMWLPDSLTVLLGLSGLGAAFVLGRDLTGALIGAAVAFGALAAVSTVYRRTRGRDGLGDGDPYLFAGIGAWVGWIGLPSVLLWACAGALSWIAARRLTGRPLLPGEPTPFGPWLALGAWLTWVFGAIGA